MPLVASLRRVILSCIACSAAVFACGEAARPDAAGPDSGLVTWDASSDAGASTDAGPDAGEAKDAGWRADAAVPDECGCVWPTKCNYRRDGCWPMCVGCDESLVCPGDGGVCTWYPWWGVGGCLYHDSTNCSGGPDPLRITATKARMYCNAAPDSVCRKEHVIDFQAASLELVFVAANLDNSERRERPIAKLALSQELGRAWAEAADNGLWCQAPLIGTSCGAELPYVFVTAVGPGTSADFEYDMGSPLLPAEKVYKAINETFETFEPLWDDAGIRF